MKKLLLLLTLMLFAPLAMFAQDPTITTPPEGWTGFFASIAAIVPLVTFIAAYLNKAIKLSGFAKQAVSWLVAIVLSFIASKLSLGIFAGLAVWQVLTYGIGIGLVANGFFDIKLVQIILDMFGAGKKPATK